MADNRIYLALGEETQRGVKESATVGFLPVLSPGIPRLEFDDKRKKEFRGEDSTKGDTRITRMGCKWSGSIETAFYTESGGDKSLAGKLLKHFFGKASSAQSGATGQYNHTLYPVSDPFSTANLGEKALTLNVNINEGALMKNWPFVGGRVKSLAFEQSAGEPLKLTAELMGQKRDTVTAEIGAPVFADESLRCDYNNLKIYTGNVGRIGAAPEFTDFDCSSAVRIKPDKVAVKLENNMEDVVRLSGLDHPDKTRMGQFKASIELTIDWEDPASGFSSVDEFNSWAQSTASETNFLLHWDTGTQAGSGANHALFIDLPRAVRAGGAPEYSLEKDPMITLKYDCLYDADTAKYIAAALLRNTAASI